MLLRHEMRKLLAGRTKWLLLVLLLANSCLFYLYMMPYTKTPQEIHLHRQVLAAGRERADLAAALAALPEDLARCAATGDTELSALLESVREQAEEEYRQAAEFAAFIGGFQERAQSMLDFSIFALPGSFSYRNIHKTARDFGRLDSLAVWPADSSGLQAMQDCFLSDILLLAAMGLLSFQLFGRDAATGVDRIIRATPRGGRHLRMIQMGLAALGAAGFAALLYGTNLILTAWLAGFPDLGLDLHGTAAFRNIPYPCTAGQYLTGYLAWKIFYAAGLALLFSCFVYLLRGSKAAWLATGTLAAVSFLLWFYLPETPVSKIFRYLNLIGLADTGQIWGNYQNLNLFGFPVELRTAAIGMLGVWVLASAALLLCLRPMQLRIALPQREKPLPQTSRRWLLACELAKGAGRQKAAVLLAAVLVCGAFLGPLRPSLPYLLPEDYFYRQQSEELLGKGGTELQAALAALEKQSAEFTDADQHKALQRIQLQAACVLQQQGCQFVDASRWEPVLLDRQADLTLFLCYCLAVIFAVNGTFQVEARTRMKGLLLSCGRGSRVYGHKLAAVWLQSGAYMAILLAARLLWCARQYGFPLANAPASSLPQLASLPAGLSLGGLVALSAAQKLLAGLAITAVLFVLAQFLLSSSQFVIGAAAIFLLPEVLLLIADLDYINPLIQVLRGTVAPYLEWLYSLFSWLTALETAGWAPGLVLPPLAALVLVLLGHRRWQHS